MCLTNELRVSELLDNCENAGDCNSCEKKDTCGNKTKVEALAMLREALSPLKQAKTQ